MRGLPSCAESFLHSAGQVRGAGQKKSYELATPSVQRLSHPPGVSGPAWAVGQAQKRVKQASALGLSSKRAGSKAQAMWRLALMHTGLRPLPNLPSLAGAKGSERRGFLDREVKGADSSSRDKLTVQAGTSGWRSQASRNSHPRGKVRLANPPLTVKRALQPWWGPTATVGKWPSCALSVTNCLCRMETLRCVCEELQFGLVVVSRLSRAEMFQAHPKTASVGLAVSGSQSYELHLQLLSVHGVCRPIALA